MLFRVWYETANIDQVAIIALIRIEHIVAGMYIVLAARTLTSICSQDKLCMELLANPQVKQGVCNSDLLILRCSLCQGVQHPCDRSFRAA